MTVSPEIEAQIQRAHFVDHWPVGTIATQLGVHHDVVRRVLGIEARNTEAKRRAKCGSRPIVDSEIGASWTPRSAIVDTEIGHRGHQDRPSWTPWW
jgi:hypothetical protein